VGLGSPACWPACPRIGLKNLIAADHGLTVVSLIAVRSWWAPPPLAPKARWISIGGFHVQPSEFAKPRQSCCWAGVLSRFPDERPIRPACGFRGDPDPLVFWCSSSLTWALAGSEVVLLVMLFWAGMSLQWVVRCFSPLAAARWTARFAHPLALLGLDSADGLAGLPLPALVAGAGVAWRSPPGDCSPCFNPYLGPMASRTTNANPPPGACSSDRPKDPLGGVPPAASKGRPSARRSLGNGPECMANSPS